MKKKILLVEYANSTIEIIKDILSNPLFEIKIAGEGETAKQCLQEESFDLLITAAMLPKFHGFSLSQYAANHFPGIKIIIISDIYKGIEYKHQAILLYKANDFFEIPFNKDAFKNKIIELLDIQESDLEAQLKHVASTPPISDTTKIPTLPALEEEARQLSSEDLFGDIIEQIHADPGYEIKLNGDTSKKTIPFEKKDNKPETRELIKTPGSPSTPAARPTQPPASMNVTQPLPAMNEKQQEAPPRTQVITPPVTREIPVKESPRTQIPQPSTSRTQPITPPVTQMIPNIKQPASKPNAPLRSDMTQKIDLELLDMLKNESRTKSEKQTRDKRIENEVSKKLDDTLSGLGIAPKKPVVKETPAPQKDTQPLPAQAASDSDSLEGYELLGLIGRGGMAEIYKAKRKGVKGFEKIIALKKILTGYGEDAKYIEMFVDEAKIAAQLTHPNIVQIYDLGKKDDSYFIAMEYVPGKDLRVILNKLSVMGINMPEEISIYLMLKVLEALNYAHSARDGVGRKLEIVHRDVSPPNILVSYDGNVKLTDFGVSKASIKMHQTLAGALKGKILYMSPEQAKGNENIDFRSDLYSVGIILFELLTGEKLFLGPSEITTLNKVQEGRIIKPSQIKKGIDPELEAIVLKSLEKDIDKRYQKASEMIKELDGYLSKNFDNSPEASHISHYLYTLFKEEINKEKIDYHISPIPHPIRRIKREPEKETIVLKEPQSFSMIQPEPPAPKPSIQTPPPVSTPIVPPTQPTPRPETPPPAEILELTPDDQLQEEPPHLDEFKKEIPSAGFKTEFIQSQEAAKQEEFQPLVEINFDDDDLLPPPPPPTLKATKSAPLKSQPQVSQSQGLPSSPKPVQQPSPTPFSAVDDIHHHETNKKKRNLLIIFLIVIAVLAIVIIYILLSGSSSQQYDSGKAVKTPTPAGQTQGATSSPSSPQQGTIIPEVVPSTTTAATTTTTVPAQTLPPSTQVPGKETDNKAQTLPVKQDAKATNTTTTPQKEEKKETEIPKVDESKKLETLPTTVPIDKKSEEPAVEVKKQPAEPEPAQIEKKETIKEGDILSPTDVDTLPTPTETPPILLSQGIQRLLTGEEQVLVSYLVDQNGNVEIIKIIKKSNLDKINNLIIDTVKKWKFKPATKNNIRVKVWKNQWIKIKK